MGQLADLPLEDARAILRSLCVAFSVETERDAVRRQARDRKRAERDKRKPVASVSSDSHATTKNKPATGHAAVAESLVTAPPCTPPSGSVGSEISNTNPPDPERAPAREDASPREQDYQRAYEHGIARGKGSPYAMPEAHRGVLHQAILAHSGGRRAEKLLRWIELEAEQFAQWLAKQPQTSIGFYSSFGPRGWLKFMNETPVEQPGPPKPLARTNGGPPVALGAAFGRFVGGSQ